MTATDVQPNDQSNARLGPLFTALTTAALLVIAALVVGVDAGGTRAGVVEVLAVLVTTAIFGRAAYNGTLPRPFNASLGLMMMVLFTGVTALSVGWSILPNESMLDALRLVSYTCILALAALLAQIHQERSREIALGIGLASLILIVYALGSRCFPGLYPETDTFARLRLPFGYWNAVGTVAAIGFVAALWAGTRRTETRAIEIVSYPAGGLLFAGLMLSQSRGALLALFAGLAVWLLIFPRRLRSGGWLLVVGAIGGLLVAWAYGQTELTTDNLPIDARESVGWKLFIGLLLMTAALTAAGWFVRKRRHMHPLGEARRRGVGKTALIALAISPFVLALAIGVGTDRGFATITDAPGDFFTTSSVAPSNSPSRYTQTSSLRGRYWSESYKIFKAHTWHGTGADSFAVARLPYRPDLLMASHSHGMVPQVAADLGVLGLLTLLGLALAWLVAAFKLAGAAWKAPWRWLSDADEARLSAVALMIVAVVFGVHSAVDWVWFLPGIAFFGLVAGGWVLGSPAAHSRAAGAVAEPSRGGTAQIVRAAAIGLTGLLIAWGIYQPVRASQKVDKGIDLAQSDPAEAIELGRDAIDLDPTSAKAYMLVSAAQNNDDHPKQAEGTLLALVIRQPNNPDTWMRLAQFRLYTMDDPDGAIEALRPVFYISKHDLPATALLAEARQKKADQLLETIAEKKRKKLEKQIDELERLQQQASGQTPAT